MKFRDYLGEDQVANLKQKLEEALDSEQGAFVLIMNQEANRISDAYMGVCADCVMHITHHTVESALKAGTLAHPQVAKAQGHGHDDRGKHGG